MIYFNVYSNDIFYDHNNVFIETMNKYIETWQFHMLLQ